MKIAVRVVPMTAPRICPLPLFANDKTPAVAKPAAWLSRHTQARAGHIFEIGLFYAGRRIAF
jgi:hypothetical protein